MQIVSKKVFCAITNTTYISALIAGSLVFWNKLSDPLSVPALDLQRSWNNRTLRECFAEWNSCLVSL